MINTRSFIHNVLTSAKITQYPSIHPSIYPSTHIFICPLLQKHGFKFPVSVRHWHYTDMKFHLESVSDSVTSRYFFSLISHHFPQLPLTFSSVQFSSVAQSCPTLCDPMNHSTPGLPVHHQLPEFTQTYVHRVEPSTVTWMLIEYWLLMITMTLSLGILEAGHGLPPSILISSQSQKSHNQ